MAHFIDRRVMTGTLAQALRWASGQLAEAGIERPWHEARLLAAHSLDCDLAQLLLREDGPFDSGTFDHLVARRAAYEPMAYITGQRGFWRHDFEVGPDVLIPRPETELLVERGIDLLSGMAAPRILDLGTGSGAILLSLLGELPSAYGVGVDRSGAALEYSSSNAQRLALSDRCAWLCGDWGTPLAGRFDLIVTNPPYVSDTEYAVLDPGIRHHEPKEALLAGRDGLDAYRAIARHLPALMSPDAYVLLEIGFRQAKAVTQVLRNSGLTNPIVHSDLAGKERCIQARLTGPSSARNWRE